MLYIKTPYIFVFDIVVPDQCRSMVCVSATSPRCLSVTKVNLSSRCGTSPRKRSRPRLMSPHWSGKYQCQDSTCIIQGNSVYQFYLIIVVHSFCLSCYFMFLCHVVSVEHTRREPTFRVFYLSNLSSARLFTNDIMVLNDYQN